MNHNFPIYAMAFVLQMMVLVLFRYRKKIHILRERVFQIMILTAFICLVSDVIGLLGSISPELFPVSLVGFVRKFYLVSIVGVSACVLLYTLSEIFQSAVFAEPARLMIIAPLTVAVLAICNLDVSTVTPQGEYRFGPAVYVSMGFTLVYVFWSIYYAIRYKKRLNGQRRTAIFLTAFIFILCGCFQVFFQDWRLMSLGISLFEIYMYIGLENPEEYTDLVLNIFSRDALNLYVRNLCSEHKKCSLIYLMIKDLDYIKETMGPETAQELLKEVAKWLNGVEGAQVYHYGQDDFVLTFSREQFFMKRVQMIRRRFQTIWNVRRGDTDLDLELSLILVAYPSIRMQEEMESEEVFEVFDYFINRAKRVGESDYICIDRRQIQEINVARHVRNVLETCIREQRIEVYYQPVFSVKDNRCIELEALLRIRDERGLFLPAAMIISAAENEGSIINLGLAVFEQVCKFASESDLKRAGIAKISLNLSVIQLQQQDMGRTFGEIMERYNVPATLFRFEIPQAILGYMTRNMRRNMNQLINQGCAFVVDHCDGRMESIERLDSMLIEQVKLDPRMTAAFFENSKVRQNVKLMVKVMKQMKMSLTAVGVENQRQYMELKNMGIPKMQGYAFYRPMSGTEVLGTLEVEHALNLGRENARERRL